MSNNSNPIRRTSKQEQNERRALIALLGWAPEPVPGVAAERYVATLPELFQICREKGLIGARCGMLTEIGGVWRNLAKP